MSVVEDLQVRCCAPTLAGIKSFAAEDVICCEAPDDAGKANCIALGKAMT